jgi:hypothetical protein
MPKQKPKNLTKSAKDQKNLIYTDNVGENLNVKTETETAGKLHYIPNPTMNKSTQHSPFICSQPLSMFTWVFNSFDVINSCVCY